MWFLTQGSASCPSAVDIHAPESSSSNSSSNNTPPLLTLLTRGWWAQWPTMSLSSESGMAQGRRVPPCGRSSQVLLVKLGDSSSPVQDTAGQLNYVQESVSDAVSASVRLRSLSEVCRG